MRKNKTKTAAQFYDVKIHNGAVLKRVPRGSISSLSAKAQTGSVVV